MPTLIPTGSLCTSKGYALPFGGGRQRRDFPACHYATMSDPCDKIQTMKTLHPSIPQSTIEFTDAFINYQNITYNASAAQVEQATQWYADAEMLAHDMVSIFAARGIDANVEKCASIISAFSPRQRWARNVVQALEFAHGGTPKTLTNNLRMAQNALVLGFDALRGMKTNNFARAIAGDENAVTIDVWMMRAAGMNNDSPNLTQYRELVQAVNNTAIIEGLTPRTTQALIWIVYRGSAA